ncbi:MAG: hypothetical protein WKF59_02930 [Chitinophagaceae bacterium]
MKQLNKLGGRRIAPLQKCDLDFDSDAEEWFSNVFRSLNGDHADAVALPAHVMPKKSTGKKTIPALCWHISILMIKVLQKKRII